MKKNIFISILLSLSLFIGTKAMDQPFFDGQDSGPNPTTTSSDMIQDVEKQDQIIINGPKDIVVKILIPLMETENVARQLRAKRDQEGLHLSKSFYEIEKQTILNTKAAWKHLLYLMSNKKPYDDGILLEDTYVRSNYNALQKLVAQMSVEQLGTSNTLDLLLNNLEMAVKNRIEKLLGEEDQKLNETPLMLRQNFNQIDWKNVGAETKLIGKELCPLLTGIVLGSVIMILAYAH